MRFLIILLAVIRPLCAAAVDEVDPFVGSAKGGNTFPGALRPWGMASPSPHNDLGAPSGYTHGKPALFGFGQLHLSGVGCPELGNIALLPRRGDLVPGSASGYSKELARPGWYKAQLEGGINAEMTATTRTSMLRFQFEPGSATAGILLDLSQAMLPVSEAALKPGKDGAISGYAKSGGFCGKKDGRRVYFCLRSLPAPEKISVWKGKDKGAGLAYAEGTAEVLVKVGLSYVSEEGARQNLEAENPGWNFDECKAAAEAAWEAELSKLNIVSGDAGLRRGVYTALYHSLIHPNIFSDVSGDYQGHRGSGVKHARDRDQYSVFSLWDTYRTLHPLLIFLYPKRQAGMLKSMEAMARHSGWLPKWELAGAETFTMVGDPALPVIADSYEAGLRDFDADTVWKAAWRSATSVDGKMRPGLKSVQKYGYIPLDDSGGDFVWGSASTTLEYAYADWALSKFARSLGKERQAEWLEKTRGAAWKSLFDDATGFIRPRRRDRSFLDPFDPLAQCCDQAGWPDNGGPGFVEGNAWQYTWFVPHDIPALTEKMGGPQKFTEKLQACVDSGQFVLWNEPDMAYPWLFNYVPGESWRARKTVREAVARHFKAGPEGLPGNDDCGTTSAWLVWAALGLYPDCPGSGEYQLSSPLFEEVRLSLPNGNTLAIKDRSGDGIKGEFYFKGKRLDKPSIMRVDLMEGGDLVFE